MYPAIYDRRHYFMPIQSRVFVSHLGNTSITVGNQLHAKGDLLYEVSATTVTVDVDKPVPKALPDNLDRLRESIQVYY